MKSIILNLVLLGAAWCFPKGDEELKFKNLHVHPLEPVSGNVIPRIINGVEVVPHSIPYQAYLIVASIYGYRWLCAGVLISPSYVLTAAHCIFDGASAEVYLGVHNVHILESTRVIVTSETLIPHEGYDEATISNDIGLIEFPAPVSLNEYINVVPLPSATTNSYEGLNARVSGWGVTDRYGTTSPVLLEVNSTVISNILCGLYYGVVADSQLCTSGDGGRGVCDGDSGGPLVVDNELVGIVSYGSFDCLSGHPSGFTRVTSYLGWIEENSDIKL